MAGIYVHIPFCRRKCFYCDFFSIGAKNAPWHDYVSALIAELDRCRSEIPATNNVASERKDTQYRKEEAQYRKEEGKYRREEGQYSREDGIFVGENTIYIGGGTPSLLPHGELLRLCRVLTSALPDVGEFTMEVNPEGVTEELVHVMLECGINRVSMGVQSFCDAELRAVGRRHTAAQARKAYELLRPVGNVSIDLIFGLPTQSLKSWQESISQALELRPEHISAYSLMWEERTALSKMLRQGRVKELEEGATLRMYEMLHDSLTAAGYSHYEISNYALPGYESRHNSSYWKGEPYLGLGPGAHSYDGGTIRRANPCDIREYISHFLQGNKGDFFIEEQLSTEEMREEYIMTRLRTRQGICLPEYEKFYGRRELDKLLKKASRHIGAGNLMENQGRLFISEKAMMLLDAIIVDLL